MAKEREIQLMTLIANGDERAFRELYDLYYTPLTVYANRIVGDLDIALDIVQNIFVGLYSERERMLQISSIRSYLYQSVHNHSLNEIKHQKIVQKHQQETLKNASSQKANNVNITEDVHEGTNTLDDATPEELIEYAELQSKIEQAISSLPSQCQLVFRMSRMEEKTNDEIAAELNLSKRTVETQISKALKRLRDVLLSIIIAIAML
ncbi:MAG: RNA polymerase sigma-70 factor [Bacteroidales bacterium]|nr:RNA polymerase sigma-70 factor [Bacteroidales bacterium]